MQFKENTVTKTIFVKNQLQKRQITIFKEAVTN